MIDRFATQEVPIGAPKNEIELQELIPLGFFGEPGVDFDYNLYERFLDNIRN